MFARGSYAVYAGLSALAAVLVAAFAFLRTGRGEHAAANGPVLRGQLRALRATWRMPPLDALPAPKLSLGKRAWMGVLRAYLVAAVVLVAVKVVQVAVAQ